MIKWTPVTEATPIKTGIYLTQTEFGCEMMFYFTANGAIRFDYVDDDAYCQTDYVDNGFCVYNGDEYCLRRDVFAWSELPELIK